MQLLLFLCVTDEIDTMNLKLSVVSFVLKLKSFIFHSSPSSEDQYSQWRWETLLLPPLYLRCGHGEHPTRLQWLSRHHPADAPAAVRAIVMREVWPLAKKKTLGLRKTLTPESQSLTPPFHRSVWRTRSQNALTRKHTLNPELGLMQTSYLQ